MKTIEMKTETPTELDLHISKTEGQRRGGVVERRHENHSARPDAGGSSSEEKKRSLFHRPRIIMVAAAFVIIGIGYGAFALFHSFTHETTDDAFIDVHFVSVAPKIAGRVTEVYVDDNQLVKKGVILVEIDPRDF